MGLFIYLATPDDCRPTQTFISVSLFHFPSTESRWIDDRQSLCQAGSQAARQSGSQAATQAVRLSQGQSASAQMNTFTGGWE
jgi:hypothetical protein